MSAVGTIRRLVKVPLKEKLGACAVDCVAQRLYIGCLPYQGLFLGNQDSLFTRQSTINAAKNGCTQYVDLVDINMRVTCENLLRSQVLLASASKLVRSVVLSLLLRLVSAIVLPGGVRGWLFCSILLVAIGVQEFQGKTIVLDVAGAISIGLVIVALRFGGLRLLL